MQQKYEKMKILASGPTQNTLSTKIGTCAKRGSSAQSANTSTPAKRAERTKHEYKHPR